VTPALATTSVYSATSRACRDTSIVWVSRSYSITPSSSSFGRCVCTSDVYTLATALRRRALAGLVARDQRRQLVNRHDAADAPELFESAPTAFVREDRVHLFGRK